MVTVAYMVGAGRAVEATGVTVTKAAAVQAEGMAVASRVRVAGMEVAAWARVV